MAYIPTAPVNLLSVNRLEARDIQYNWMTNSLIDGATGTLVARLVNMHDVKCIVDPLPPGDNDFATGP
ncbi:hypothetical protein IMZ48_29580 [Candidatus Bathyarchaeota archaeon]|nr:hypothetical protein [Candidatus Bathyarchaeota archaeon]